MASAAVWGTARNTTSASATAESSWATKERSVLPVKPGYSRAMGVPASSLDVAATNRNSGCPRIVRTSSMPAKPAAPTIADLLAHTLDLSETASPPDSGERPPCDSITDCAATQPQPRSERILGILVTEVHRCAKRCKFLESRHFAPPTGHFLGHPRCSHVDFPTKRLSYSALAARTTRIEWTRIRKLPHGTDRRLRPNAYRGSGNRTPRSLP